MATEEQEKIVYRKKTMAWRLDTSEGDWKICYCNYDDDMQEGDSYIVIAENLPQRGESTLCVCSKLTL